MNPLHTDSGIARCFSEAWVLFIPELWLATRTQILTFEAKNLVPVRDRLHPQDAADLARDTIANDWNWQMVKGNFTAAEQGLLDRAARALGIT